MTRRYPLRLPARFRISLSLASLLFRDPTSQKFAKHGESLDDPKIECVDHETRSRRASEDALLSETKEISSIHTNLVIFRRLKSFHSGAVVSVESNEAAFGGAATRDPMVPSCTLIKARSDPDLQCS